MTKIRIYELARELELNSKEVVDTALELGYDVKNHMSNLEPDQREKIQEYILRAEKLDGEPQQQKEEKQQKKEIAATAISISSAGHTVGELAKLFATPATKIIKALMSLGVMATINQHLDADTIEILATQMEVKVSFQKQQSPADNLKSSESANAVERSPVVTVMGHVDHGKTSLLDAIRHANVTASEAGGITQHIGAYRVEHQDKNIVFIDTPGHEAFTAMRARGTRVTDVAVLVVAADEGIKPQTIEAMNHAKAAEVPIIIALNKMDKPGANPDRVKQQFTNHGLMPEDWGGDTIYVEVSALNGSGINDLLEMILLVSEMLELKADVTQMAQGTVIDSKLDKGRGVVATVLIQQGTLSVGDCVFCGTAYGKVRAMFNDRGQRIDSAGPSVPVEILGLSSVPPAGEILAAVANDRLARAEADLCSQRQRDTNMTKTRVSLEDMFKQMETDQVQELNLMLKSDVHGTTEALKQSLNKIDVDKIDLNIIHTGVGAINSTDVMLASASSAIIIGFNVRPDLQAQKLAEEEKVEIRLYRVIYDVLEDVQKALEGLLEPEYKELVIGRVDVRSTFHHSKIGSIAGCYVTDGKVTNKSMGRLLRDGKIIYEGKISSLKRFKDDVKEVKSGYECGLMLENYSDIKVGDQVEVYTMVEDEK